MLSDKAIKNIKNIITGKFAFPTSPVVLNCLPIFEEIARGRYEIKIDRMIELKKILS